MSVIKKDAPGANEHLMGNEAIARGALEAGVKFAAAYPGETAVGSPAPAIDIAKLCRALGVRVETVDPFDLQAATEKILNLIGDEGGVRVLISRRKCALVKAKEEKAAYRMRVDPEKCLGEACGCARICTRIFKCPGLIWSKEKGKSQIDEVICSGCGVCADICPRTAILREEN